MAEINNDNASKYESRFADQLYTHCASGKSASCFRVPGITRQTMWNWLQSNQEFIDARAKGEDAWQTFLEGLVYYKVTGMKSEDLEKKGITDINGPMLRFILKNKFRRDYAERIETDHSGEVVTKINFIEMPGRESLKEESEERVSSEEN